MVLFLVVTSGPQAGSSFPLYLGTTIGRAKGSIVLSDPRISSLHAKVESAPSGGLLLVDQGSSNKIRFQGQKVESLPLLPGVAFSLGETHFEVKEGEAVAATNERDEKTELNSGQDLGWRGTLSDFFEAQARSSKGPKIKKNQKIQMFSSVLILEFTRGFQSPSQWTLGYGPRSIGSQGGELTLSEPGAQPTAFEILPHKTKGATIKVKDPKLRINYKEVSEEVLKEGDLLTLGQTQIVVRYKK